MVTPPFTHTDGGTDPAAWRDHPSWGDVPLLELRNGAEPCTRLVVVSAHPDDESLGAGGLVATAHAAGLDVYAVLLTAGEASHPGSPTTSPQRLASLRLAEMRQALAALAPGAPYVFLGAPDGGVAEVESDATTMLVNLVGDGRRTLLVAPYRHDGHPDHEAAGRAAAAAARRTGARLVEYPVWMWHHAHPVDAPWASMLRLDLDEAASAAKQRAVLAHDSQVRPLSSRPGDEVLLPPRLLEHFATPTEHYVVDTALVDPALDTLHLDDADPWGVEWRWYEQRKRALTLAALPRERFRRGLEVGCSRGALAEALAGRCDRLVAVDSSPAAVAAARSRLGDHHDVTVEQLHLPEAWPDGGFDLVVLSETGYFVSPRDLDRLVERIAACLEPDGVVMLCHWRHPVEGWVLDGPDVHTRFRAGSLPPEAATYRDRDVEISVLCHDRTWPDPGA